MIAQAEKTRPQKLTTDDHAVRLPLGAKLGFFLRLALQPGLTTLDHAVLDALSRGAAFFSSWPLSSVMRGREGAEPC